jgi:chitinase
MYLRQMDKFLDFWNLMAYDYTGSWDTDSGHQANLYNSTTVPTSTPYNTDQAIKYYINNGVAASKINFGFPLYGRSFVGTSGPGQPFANVGSGTWQPGLWDYKDMPLAGSKEIVNTAVTASYSYDSETQTMISYDTAAVAETKAQYIKARGLGGAMYWECSSDKNGTGSIINTVVNALGGVYVMDRTPNLLSYPHSQYNNIQRQMAPNS